MCPTFFKCVWFFYILNLLEADILFQDIVMFITGVRIMPPLEIPKKIKVSFAHECPTVCRCKCTLNFHYLPIIERKRIWRNLFRTLLNYEMVLTRFELIYLNIVCPHILNLIYHQHRQPFKIHRFEIINHT